ncbi:MAG: guanylate kinase [Nitrospirota bacterium]
MRAAAGLKTTEKAGDKKGSSTKTIQASDRKGLLFVVSAPSGAGKTSLCREVTPKTPNLVRSISYTTRAPREQEVEGEDYHFVDAEKFRSMVDRNNFIEWAEVHGNLYGTSRSLLMESVDRGVDVILDIDTQGAVTIRKNSSEGVYIYILPPSLEALGQRLIDRKSDPEEEIVRRLQKSREEIWNYRHYDYVIVNGQFKKALKDLEAIILAERVRMKQINHAWIEDTFISQNKTSSTLLIASSKKKA